LTDAFYLESWQMEYGFATTSLSPSLRRVLGILGQHDQVGIMSPPEITSNLTSSPTGLRVPDINRSVQFYPKMVGLNELGRTSLDTVTVASSLHIPRRRPE
jgi:hypothetical protein